MQVHYIANAMHYEIDSDALADGWGMLGEADAMEVTQRIARVSAAKSAKVQAGEWEFLDRAELAALFPGEPDPEDVDNGRPHLRFTASEDATIRGLWSVASNQDLGHMLGRSVSSIYNRAARLGLVQAGKPFHHKPRTQGN